MVAARKRTSEEFSADDGAQAVRPEVSSIFGHTLPENWRELVGADPVRTGDDRARLLGPGISVWAIIGHLRALGPEFNTKTINQTAFDFMIEKSAVVVAIAYYLEHREAIDARLIVNAIAVS